MVKNQYIFVSIDDGFGDRSRHCFKAVAWGFHNFSARRSIFSRSNIFSLLKTLPKISERCCKHVENDDPFSGQYLKDIAKKDKLSVAYASRPLWLSIFGSSLSLSCFKVVATLLPKRRKSLEELVNLSVEYLKPTRCTRLNHSVDISIELVLQSRVKSR